MNNEIRFVTEEETPRYHYVFDHHKEYKQSKNGGIDPKDVILVMGDNNISHLVLPTLRRHRILVFFIIYTVYAVWFLFMFYGWSFLQ
jgi:hypothetical protein